jgi:hypothetical protein
MRLFVVTQDAVIVDRPKSKGRSRAIAYPKYLVPLVAYTQTSDQQYFLVKNPRTSRWGWIAKAFVLEAYEPLRHANAAEPAFLKALLNPPLHKASHDQATKIVFFHGPGSLNDTSLHSGH